MCRKNLQIQKIVVPLQRNRENDSTKTKNRAFSSAGSEHLPYKQRVGGSNPSTPTKERSQVDCGLFFILRAWVYSEHHKKGQRKNLRDFQIESKF